MCQADTLADFCSDNTEEKAEFDFSGYVTKLSKMIYSLLVWSVYLYGKSNTAFPPTAWRKVLVNAEKDVELSLAIVKSKVQTITEELNGSYGTEFADREKMKLVLKDKKEVTENNAYLYVRGHDLLDHLVNTVIGSIVAGLRSKHYSRLRDSNMDDTERRTALMEYQEKDTSVRELLQKNFRYKDTSPLYERIKHDVSLIWPH